MMWISGVIAVFSFILGVLLMALFVNDRNEICERCHAELNRRG